MRILGVDFGDSRTGISMSDSMGMIAQGLFNNKKKKGVDYIVSEINKLVKEYNVEKIVVGYPLNLDGSIGIRAEKTLKFIEKLQDVCGISVIKWDERLSTVAAQKLMIETNVRRTKKREKVDIIAATYILQGYLDSICKK